MIESCATCKNQKNGKCKILEEVLLTMCYIQNNKEPSGYEKPNVKLIIKDAYLTKFKCNSYQRKD